MRCARTKQNELEQRIVSNHAYCAMLSVVLAAASTSSAWAYEVDTHALATRRAYERSVLATEEIRQRLGWDRYRDNSPFSAPDALLSFSEEDDGYWDVEAHYWSTPDWPTALDRRPRYYELSKFPGEFRGPSPEANDNQYQVLAWLMRGAVREDDLRSSDYGDEVIPPDQDPHGELIRVFHHFYDPVHDRALTPAGLNCETLPLPGAPADGRCRAATDWAMGLFG